MRTQALIAGWILSAVLVVVASVWLVNQWITLGRLGASAQQDLARLTTELESQQNAIQTELASNADVMRRLRWSPERGSAGETVRRLATLAHGGQAKVLAISAVENESTPRFRKSWHRITMTSSFPDLVDFAAKVEEEGGILEDVTVEPIPDDRGARPGDLRSQFRLTALEPSDQGRAIMDRVMAAAKASGTPVAAALTLPVESFSPGRAVGLRDPFRPAPKARPAVAVAGARVPAAPGPAPVAPASPPPILPPPPVPVVPISVKGIVKFPGGAMAIVNEQIVGVGDVVSGHRVQEIGDGRVVLAVPGGEPRIAQLPGFAAAPRNTR